MAAKTIAVLFARPDSIYHQLDGADVWDINRDARRWPGGAPVVAHPPCRAWGRLRTFAKPRDDEKDLARFAVAMVRKYGGVLEHPAGSTLWADQNMPPPGTADESGGWTLGISQVEFGHRAEKKTLLYIVGVEPKGIPPLPLTLDYAPRVISTRSNRDPRQEVTKREREATPLTLARWLLELARATTISST